MTRVLPRPAARSGRLLPLLLALTGAAFASPADDAKAVAALDTEYQAAVERNDAATMARILHDEFTLVLGDGRTFDKAALLKTANGDWHYDVQAEEPGTQQVRVTGDTAVVTALLLLKGTHQGRSFDRRLWFSDTYVRTPQGWKYFFGQASLALPPASPKPAT
jgi:ketosteroid isomerase-like protein